MSMIERTVNCDALAPEIFFNTIFTEMALDYFIGCFSMQPRENLWQKKMFLELFT